VASILLNDVIEIRAYCYLQNQLSVNDLWFQAASVTPNSTIEDLATMWEASAAVKWRQFIAASAVWIGIHAKIARPGTSFRPVFRNATFGAGTTNHAFSLPKQTAGLITKLTDKGGRAGHGRVYVPFPFMDETQEMETPTVPQQDAMTTIAQWCLLPHVVGSVGMEVNLVPVLINRKTKLPTPIIGFRVSKAWATQRRRSDFGRVNAVPAW
jgi:hypothetical protein